MMVAAINASIYINAESKQFLPKNPMLPFFFFKNPNGTAERERAVLWALFKPQAALQLISVGLQIMPIASMGLVYLYLTININQI